jgi:hypothetical protein
MQVSQKFESKSEEGFCNGAKGTLILSHLEMKLYIILSK